MGHFGSSFLNSPRLAFPTPTHLSLTTLWKSFSAEDVSPGVGRWDIEVRQPAGVSHLLPVLPGWEAVATLRTTQLLDRVRAVRFSGPFGKPPVAAALSPTLPVL